MTVSVVVVSYQTRELILRCLGALRTGSADEVIVVDNASTDGSPDAVAAAFPEVRLIRLAENVGWGRAVNRAAEYATGDHLLLLNPDTVPRGDVVAELARFAAAYPEHPIVTGRTLRPDGTDDGLSCLGLPTLHGYVCFALGLTSLFRRSRLCNPEALPGLDRRSVHQVPAVSGCLMLISRKAFAELGGFDPAYFLYSEDVDLCLRARRLGWRPPLLDPDAVVVHVGGASQEPAGKRIRMLSGRATYLRLRWYGWRRRAGLALLAIGVLLRAAATPAWRQVWRARRTWLPGWRT